MWTTLSRDCMICTLQSRRRALHRYVCLDPNTQYLDSIEQDVIMLRRNGAIVCFFFLSLLCQRPCEAVVEMVFLFCHFSSVGERRRKRLLFRSQKRNPGCCALTNLNGITNCNFFVSLDLSASLTWNPPIRLHHPLEPWTRLFRGSDQASRAQHHLCLLWKLVIFDG